MIGKPGSPALLGMAVLCALVLGACSNGASLHFVTVTPVSATVYFGAGTGSGVKAARANAVRKGAVVVSPQDITNATCRSQQFMATAFFSDGSSMDESNAVTWTSSNTSVASVSSTGNAFATGSGVGTVNIGATFNGTIASPASLEVDQLNSITMSPLSANIASKASQQFVANGNFTLASGSAAQQPIVATQLTWMSSNTNLVTVDANGNATSTGNGSGQVTITATSCDGLMGTAKLTVASATTLVSIAVTPTNPSIAVGLTQQFTATGTYSDNSTLDITSQVNWNSATTTVATITSPGGLATAVGTGTSNITASLNGVTSAPVDVLTVTAPAVTLVITPSTPTIAAGTTLQFLALTHSDNSPVLNPVTWQSVSTNVATIDAASGLALGVASGSSTIMASETENGTTFTGNITLTVSAAAARYAYVGNLARASISSYTVTAGVLAPNNGPTGQSPYPFPTPNPAQVLIHPSGDFLYAINDGCSVYSVFVASTTGVLTANTSTQITNPTATGAVFPCFSVMDPPGRFLYVVGSGNSGIYGFQITQSSAQTAANQTVAGLTAIAPVAPYTAGTFPDWIMIDRTGQFLYVVNTGFDGTTQGQGSISQYGINADGTLSALNPASINVGNGSTNGPFFGTIDRHNNLFVANLGTGANDETVTAFSIGANGQLTLLGDTPISGAIGTTNVITSPVADNLYVLDASGGQVFAFSYAISGTPAAIALTAISGGASQPTGSNTNGMAIDPTGTLLLIDDAGTNNGALSVPGSVFVYTVGANGGLPNPATTVPADVGAEFVQFYTALPGQ